MRALAVLLLLALPMAADAQQRDRPQRGDRSTPPPRSEQRVQPPRPTHPIQPMRPFRAEPTPRIGSPLVPAGWQWFGTSRRGFSIGNPYLPAGRQWFGDPGDARRRPGHGGMYPGQWYPYGYGGGIYYGDGYYAAEQQDEASRFATAPPPPPATGLLRLDITPSTGLEYYSDGFLIGTSSDLGTEFEINAGARRIEIRAAGYRPLIFDTRINEGQITTFRAALEPLQGDEPAPRASGSKTLYVIRGCYIGNKKPDAADLPKGCDINRMTTR